MDLVVLEVQKVAAVAAPDGLDRSLDAQLDPVGPARGSAQTGILRFTYVGNKFCL